MRRIRFSVVILVSVTCLLASCGSSSYSAISSPTSTPTSNPASTATTTSVPADTGPAVMIENGGSAFRFITSPVQAGASVIVKNDTTVQHTVSADTTAGGFDVTVDPGKTVTFTAPSKPGVYKFHCNIHTYMTGALTVT